MRGRLGVFAHLLTLTYRAGPAATVWTSSITVSRAFAVALLATSQRWLVDHAGMGFTSSIVGVALLGAAAHVATVAGGRIQGTKRASLNESVDIALNDDILRRTARIPTIAHLQNPAFLDRLSLLRRGTHVLAAATWSLAEVVTSVVSLGLSIWLLAGIHPALALLAALAVPPLMVVGPSQRSVKRSLQEVAESKRLEQRLHELCVTSDAGKEVRAAQNGGELSALASSLWDAAAAREMRGRVRAAAMQLGGWVGYAIGYAAALVAVAHMAVDGSATVGDLVLVLTVAARLRNQVSQTVSNASRIAESSTVVEAYQWLLEYDRGRPVTGLSAPERLEDGIRLRDVSFRYEGADQDALSHVDLHLPAGSVVGLVGVNGAGKSTLVSLLLGLQRPTAGCMEIDGTPLAEVEPTAWTQRCTGTFQDYCRFNLLVREAVGVGDLDRIEETSPVHAALHRAGADGFVSRLDDGIETQLGGLFDGVELSGGQWQKIAVARGLMRPDPLLVVLDEPTAALDAEAEHELFETFAALARTHGASRGAVTVLVSHRFSTMQMTDLVVVLDHGGVIELGSHADLMRRADGVYRRLYSRQADGYR
ncbi:ABC transporter ATP-binding protein [Cellulomonas palmilytica]|uniref:ABC transporter ATP-binding protein n=1 Tax=Cellulomonas palmilytica TaxID=2608402 RepID=UPI001F168EEB|nr:ABC transporter ATP-binding protein [Cellulomonas palmilytica]UJP40687.1 ABC transporter ATP-binding protein [Cellulomonas palmilytica]